MGFDGTYISRDFSHHLKDGEPLYDKKFEMVQSFHEPGFAPVKDKTGWFFIDLNGDEVYEKKYIEAFGFYEGLAAVKDEDGCYHINPKGESAYPERYEWVGNFQEERCVVRDKEGNYFHINCNGMKVYNEIYKYAGDFKYGSAVVYLDNGFATHIDQNGNRVHEHQYIELMPYHKGFAVARDEKGYFHVNRHGKAIYNDRFKCAEPFYNGQAFARTFDDELVVINEFGERIIYIGSKMKERTSPLHRMLLSDRLVGYWHTQITYCLVRSEILDFIAEGHDTYDSLKRASKLPHRSISMLLDVAKVWGMIRKDGERYCVQREGVLLLKNSSNGLRNAAMMWSQEHYITMSRLWDSLVEQKPQFNSLYGATFFEYLMNHPEANALYNASMVEYAQDYSNIVLKFPLSGIRTILDVGGGTGALLSEIIRQHDVIEKGILFDLPHVIEDAEEMIEKDIFPKIQFVKGDFFIDKLPESDAIILSRVLHDWDDKHVEKILHQVNNSLRVGGTLFILEMVVPDEVDQDFGVTLNFNLLVTVGGRERSKTEFMGLLENTGFDLSEIIRGDGIISALVCTKKGVMCE